MLKVNKLTDYASLILGRLITKYPGHLSAQELSEVTTLPYPTVSKILKMLTVKKMLVSSKGAKGGYQLARCPDEITLADLIRAMEGPQSITECGIHAGVCQYESACTVRHRWNKVDHLIYQALDNISITAFSDSANEAELKQTVKSVSK